MKRFALISLSVLIVSLQADIVWNAEKVIDAPLEIKNENLRIEKGARIVFKGAGRLTVDGGTFAAKGAEFTGEGVLENNFRIAIRNARSLLIENCTFKDIRSSNPEKFTYGSILVRFQEGTMVRNNVFKGCSALTFVHVKKGCVEKNTFEGSEDGILFFHVTESRIVGNAFDKIRRNGIGFNSAKMNTVENNRFSDCAAGLLIQWECHENIFSGNSIFGGNTGFKLWSIGMKNLFTGNLVEKSIYAVESLNGIGTGNVFSNNVITASGHGFSFQKAASDVEITLRNNVIFETPKGIAAGGGKIVVLNSLFWQVKDEFQIRGDAVLHQEKILRANPKFKNAEESDYRPQADSPLLKAGTPEGCNIGLFQ